MMFMEHIKQYYYLLMLYNFTSAFSDSLSIISPPDSEVKLRGLSSGLGSTQYIQVEYQGSNSHFHSKYQKEKDREDCGLCGGRESREPT